MKYGFLKVLILAFAGVMAGCTSLAGKQLVGQTPPVVRVYDLDDGSQHFLSDYKGKYVVLAFWATTCTASGPIMKRLAEYAEKNSTNPSVKVLALSLDKNEDIQTLKDRIQYDHLGSMGHMFSGNEEFDEAFYGLKGERLPYVVVLDPNGRVLDVDTDDDVIYSAIP